MKIDPRRLALIEAGLRSGAAIEEVAVVAGVRVETVYRRLRSDERTAAVRDRVLRAADLKERRQVLSEWIRHPRRSLQENERFTYRALYHWLYYNDRQWLMTAVVKCKCKGKAPNISPNVPRSCDE